MSDEIDFQLLFFTHFRNDTVGAVIITRIDIAYGRSLANDGVIKYKTWFENFMYIIAVGLRCKKKVASFALCLNRIAYETLLYPCKSDY